MKKKAIAIALVLVVALGSIFAAKGSLFASKSVPSNKVGVQLGYGARSFTVTEKLTGYSSSTKTLHSGFYAAGTFEFGVSSNVALKMEAGINTMGQAKTSTKIGDQKWSSATKATENTPINFTVFTGIVYDLALNDKLSLDLGAGMDVMIGKLSSSENAETNAAFGLGAEAGVSFKIDKSVSIVGGGKFGWHFLNTNDNVQDSSSSDYHKTTNLTYKFFGGLTYSL